MTEALCTIVIDYDAIRHNYQLLSSYSTPIMPVIKSDAYGHGFIEIADVLKEEGARYLAVGTVTEAVLLRKSGIAPDQITIVPLLGCTKEKEYELCARYHITNLIHSKESLDAACAFKNAIAIKLDSGMGRMGFRAKDMEWLVGYLKDKNISPSLLISHFSSSDSIELNDYTYQQAERMAKATNILKNHYPNLHTSFGNSATILAFPELVGDIARPGITLYGGNPFYNTAREHLFQNLKPVMSLSTPILTVHSLKTGDSLSYGKSFTAMRNSMIAWIAMGYADGYRRNSAINDVNGKGGTQVVIHDTRCPVIGRINMQMTAVDITDLIKTHEVKAGDIAYILNGCKNGVKIDELAQWWDTTPYEVTTSLGKNLYYFHECRDM